MGCLRGAECLRDDLPVTGGGVHRGLGAWLFREVEGLACARRFLCWG